MDSRAPLAADARAHFSRLDYLVSCAGVLGADLRSADTPVEAFDRVNRINYRGSWLVSRAAIRAMLQQEPRQPGADRGAIVNIASQLGIVARRGAGGFFSSFSPPLSPIALRCFDNSC